MSQEVHLRPVTWLDGEVLYVPARLAPRIRAHLALARGLRDVAECLYRWPGLTLAVGAVCLGLASRAR